PRSWYLSWLAEFDSRVRSGAVADGRRTAQFTRGLADDLDGGGEKQGGHCTGDDEVRHRGLRGPDSARGQHYGYVADGVIAAAQPHRANIGVAVAKAHQEQHAREVRDEGGEADGAHGRRVRKR